MKKAIFTVDDIASENTVAIVDDFLKKGIRAVMFATGENLLRNYEEAKYAVKSGMIVGNHSYSHPSFSSLSVSEGIREIEACEKALDALYADCGVLRRFRPFRFPYGDKGGENREAYQRYLRENGFHKLADSRIPYAWWRESRLHSDIDTFWTYDFEEYKLYTEPGFTLESILRKMQLSNPEYGAPLLGEESFHILLMHAHDETERLFPGYSAYFTDFLIENGFTFEKPQFV